MLGGTSMPARTIRVAGLLLACTLPVTVANAAVDQSLRAKIVHAFAAVKSYKLTVLGSVRSLGVWQAPDKYEMTTEFAGKTVKTIIIGTTLWQFVDGKWEKSGTASNNLRVDVAGLVRTVKHDPSAAFVKLPDQMEDGKRVGTFEYTFNDGTEETCNYDPSTYHVTRCKADELTLLYSAYNDPKIKIRIP
jgi:hypothetical protein